MENFNSTSDFKTSADNGRYTPLPSHFPFQVPQSYTNFPTIGPKETAKSAEGFGLHHRCPSESILFDGQQPSWLDDLLNEPETEAPQVHKGHRRSASDSFTFVESSSKAFDIKDGSLYNSVAYKASTIGQGSIKVENKPSSFEERFNKGLNLGSSRSVEGKDKEESGSQNQEGSSIEGSSQAKPASSKADAKKAKQQSAHRSRVRKLQYIAQLEKTVQLLQAAGSEIAAELEFVDQQNLILSMKNRSLKQRIDNLSQEQLIKQMEHEMLEKELGRLQAVYQMQRQQQMQMQHQQMNPKNRRNKSKEANSIRGPMNGSVHHE